MTGSLQKAERNVKGYLCDMQTFCLQNAAMEQFQRLKIARERKFKTATEAAESLGVSYGTYSGHESGSRGMKASSLAKYARRFQVPLEWLSLGTGTMVPKDATMLEIAGRVGAGAQIDVDVEQAPSEREAIEVKVGLPPNTIGFEILGDSMWPRYEPGDLIVCLEDGVPLSDISDGEEAAVRTEDGIRYLKKLYKAEQPGLYNLESHNAAPIRNVAIAWAAPVEVMVPRRKR